MLVDLFSLAEREGIIIEWWNFKPPLEAVYWALPDMPPVIGLANSLKDAPRPYVRCILAEELGHHFTSAGYRIARTYLRYRDRLEISRTEYRALKWAAQMLIPLDKLVWAFDRGIVEVWELAEYFDVTEDMVIFRLNLPDIKTHSIMNYDVKRKPIRVFIFKTNKNRCSVGDIG